MVGNVPYQFSREEAKKLGKAKFLQKHSKTFPHLDIEAIWNEMFPNKKGTKQENPVD